MKLYKSKTQKPYKSHQTYPFHKIPANAKKSCKNKILYKREGSFIKRQTSGISSDSE